jgi:hypothetical protein
MTVQGFFPFPCRSSILRVTTTAADWAPRGLLLRFYSGPGSIPGAAPRLAPYTSSPMRGGQALSKGNSSMNRSILALLAIVFLVVLVVLWGSLCKRPTELVG